jgi:adenosyl cobinamide kinase/adenosyl cobinamide phosphate guanylyltransferase
MLKNFSEFYAEEFARLLKNIDRKHELGAIDVETGIQEVIDKSVRVLRKDLEEQKQTQVIVSERTGEPIVPAKDIPDITDEEVTSEKDLEKDEKK